jgi:S1-C subfamily serine protease
VCAVVEASEWPDDGDDRGPDPYLPPEQRWWRHPSELGASRLPPARPALLPAPGGGRVALVLAAVIGAAGAVLAAYVAHLAQPATSDVATSVVRVSAATTSLVTVGVGGATSAPATSAVATSAVEGLVQLVLPGRSERRSATAAALGTGQLVVSAKAVEGVTEVTAVMPDGSEQRAEVVFVDPASGTAVVEVSQPTPTVASGQAATLAPGDPITAAGTNTPGEVVEVGVDATADDGTHMEHLMRLRMERPVDDGAVVLDREGRAVGICIGAEDGDATALLAAPIELAKAAAEPAGPDGERRLAWLGLTGRTARPADSAGTASSTTTTEPPSTSNASTGSSSSSMLAAGATNGNGTTTTSAAPPTAQPAPPVTTAAAVVPVEGAFVLDVEADGAAAEAGVHKGDIVVAVDDVPVPSMNALVLLIRERKAGSEVHLTVVRDGERLELVTVLRGRKKS